MSGVPREVAEHALRLISSSKPTKQRLRLFDDVRSRAIDEEITKLPAAPDCNQPTSSSAFCPLEETKTVGINPTNPTKTVRIGTQLPAK